MAQGEGPLKTELGLERRWHQGLPSTPEAGARQGGWPCRHHSEASGLRLRGNDLVVFCGAFTMAQRLSAGGTGAGSLAGQLQAALERITGCDYHPGHSASREAGQGGSDVTAKAWRGAGSHAVRHLPRCVCVAVRRVRSRGESAPGAQLR